jgi:hypothetical protein
MARVTYGALITELAGSIGGITFQKNSSGNIARAKPNIPMIASQSQADQQYKLNSLIAIWQTLTLVQQTSWNDMAAAHDHIDNFGVTKTLNGFQWFMSCNLNILTTGSAPILAAPAWTAQPAPVAFTVVNIEAFMYVQFNLVYHGIDNKVYVYATPPIKSNNLLSRRSIFLLGEFTIDIDHAFILSTAYDAYFNTVWADLRVNNQCSIIVHIKVIDPATGLSSPFTSASLQLTP